MTLLALLRHGPTAANREHRLQGRADTPLDQAGRAAVARWRLPSETTEYRWLTSPLRRCVETASLLGLAAEIEPLLIEMDWGDWEGQALPQLRHVSPEVVGLEALGLDLQPPGGETPRSVQERLSPLFREIASSHRNTGGISHKGIIRATLSLATGWDMRAKAPIRLAWDAVHFFRLDPSGVPQIERLNCPLSPP